MKKTNKKQQKSRTKKTKRFPSQQAKAQQKQKSPLEQHLELLGSSLESIHHRQANFEQVVIENFRETYENQKSLKAGLDSAEFNLRAHQKVLNALVQEIESLVDESADGKKLLHVEGSVVEGKVHVDWAKYHQYVENDLVEVRKIEAERQKAEYTPLVEYIKTNLQTFTTYKKFQINELPEDQHERATGSLDNFVKSVEAEIALFESNGEYDTKKLKKFHGLVSASVADKPEEPQEGVSVGDSPAAGYPEGASVFGG